MVYWQAYEEAYAEVEDEIEAEHAIEASAAAVAVASGTQHRRSSTRRSSTPNPVFAVGNPKALRGSRQVGFAEAASFSSAAAASFTSERTDRHRATAWRQDESAETATATSTASQLLAIGGHGCSKLYMATHSSWLLTWGMVIYFYRRQEKGEDWRQQWHEIVGGALVLLLLLWIIWRA